MNTMVSYSGHSPYQGLFGHLPNSILRDDLEATCSAQEEPFTNLYPSQLARAEAQKVITESLLREG